MIIDLTALRWPVGGYEISDVVTIDGSEPAHHRQVIHWPAQSKPGWKMYVPAETPGLFLRFLETPATAEGVLKFARQWGLLGLHEYQARDAAGEIFKGEWLALWYEEIRAIQDAWKAWQEAMAGGPDMLPGFNFVANGIADRLGDRLQHRFRIAPSGDRLESYFRPANLIGLIWLEFSKTVTERIEWRHCAYCGVPFPVKDVRAMYCKKSCKVMASRKRREKDI